MDTKQFIDSVMKFPEEGKPVPVRNQSFLAALWFRLVRRYWRIKHLFKCEEKHMTEPAMMRYCRKCGRLGIKNPSLRDAFRKGGVGELINERFKILREKR